MSDPSEWSPSKLRARADELEAAERDRTTSAVAAAGRRVEETLRANGRPLHAATTEDIEAVAHYRAAEYDRARREGAPAADQVKLKQAAAYAAVALGMRTGG